MKNKILFAGLIAISFALWSCDEPEAFGNSDFVYNPFSFFQDTLYTITAVDAGARDITWGTHTRAWVGETQYYKSGASFDFQFTNDSLDMSAVDSIQLEIRHVETFPENGADTLASETLNYGIFKTSDPVIDIDGVYGVDLGVAALAVKLEKNTWSYTFQTASSADPAIGLTDTTASLGIFPVSTGALSAIYGGGSSLRPKLKFFFSALDTSGNDSAYTVAVQADTLFMHFKEKTENFDRTQFEYISQLKQDSLLLSLNIEDLLPGVDTLVTIDSSSLWTAIDASASAVYQLVSTDANQRFFIRVTDPVSELSINLDLGADGTYYDNEVKRIIQAAIDDNRGDLELILKPNHMGFDPGFVAISKDALLSALFVKSAQAVRP